jgi:hypothetical protein
MSAYRDSLPDEETRARYDDAILAAGRILAQASYDRDMLAATHGTRAVAEAAWYPGHPLGSIDAIQARYEQLQERARQQLDQADGPPLGPGPPERREQPR